MTSLTHGARLYIACVVASAGGLLALAAVNRPDGRLWIVAILCLLNVVGESLYTKGSRGVISISLGSVTCLAAIPLVGIWGAVMAAAATAMAHHAEPTPMVKRLFNASQIMLSVGAAGVAYRLLGGTIGLSTDSFPQVLFPILVADLVLCAVNGALVAVIIGLTESVSPVRVFQGSMVRSVVPYLAYGLFGVSLAVLWEPVGVGPMAALLLLLPLFVARWAYAQYAEEQRAYDRTVRALMAAVETKDVYTRGHSERVSSASVRIARVVGMREDRIGSLRYAGMLHDVGKLGVPTRVLQKSGRLTEGEFAAIQRHPMQGQEIVREIEFLDEAMAGIMHHHERMDGLGYPMGLAGQQIPEFARVIAVADAFDSMTTTRSYRGARTVDEAIAELRRCSGNQFDPPLVAALIAAVGEHGWTPESTPVVASPSDDPFDQEQRSFDHDDPSVDPVLQNEAT